MPNHLYRPRNVRWGGGTQDSLGTVLIPSNWQAMADLHAATGCKYMIALNLLVGPSLPENMKGRVPAVSGLNQCRYCLNRPGTVLVLIPR